MGDTGGIAALGFVFIVAGFICTGIVAILFVVGLAKGYGKASYPVSVITGILLIPLLFLVCRLGIGCSRIRTGGTTKTIKVGASLGHTWEMT